MTIVVDAATCHAYIVNYSHAETIRMEAHSEVSIGMTETEALDPDSDSSPDYDASAQEEPVTGGCLHEPPARSRQRGDAAAPAFRFRDRGGQGPRRLEDARQDGAHARTDGNPYPDGTRTRGASTGDIASMAYNMQVAFATTVVGLFAAAIGFVTGQVKQRWYLQEMTDLEFVAELLNETPAER